MAEVEEREESRTRPEEWEEPDEREAKVDSGRKERVERKRVRPGGGRGGDER